MRVLVVGVQLEAFVDPRICVSPAFVSVVELNQLDTDDTENADELFRNWESPSCSRDGSSKWSRSLYSAG